MAGKRKRAESESSGVSAAKSKKAKKPIRTQKDEKAAKAQSEALQAAVSIGMVSRKKVEADVKDEAAPPLPKAIVKCTNTEIKVKKTKGRYLFVLPGQLSVKKPGICGTLENIGSEAPILNVEFGGSGRTLKLLGSVVSPLNSYLVMQFHSKGTQVNCESSYNDLIVFHSFQWVETKTGTTSVAQSIEQLGDIADWSDPPLCGTTLKSVSLKSVTVENDDEEEDTVAETKSSQSRLKTNKSDDDDGNDDDDDDDDDDGNDDIDDGDEDRANRFSSQRSQRSSSRKASQNRKSYREVLGVDSSDESHDDLQGSNQIDNDSDDDFTL